jgi:formate hydrogenlyase subunit 3/multisubunit Na+/H+ antiporter MnhD subunit
MKRFHLIFGLIVLVVFLLTGQYMDRYHEHLRYTPDGPRMLYRTRHIFILMSGLLHLGIGSYFFSRAPGWRRALQILGSALITIAPVLFTIGFFYEPNLQGLHAPLSKAGVIISAGGALLHVVSGVKES